MSYANDIATYLATVSALSLTVGTNMFIGSEPVTPADCVTVYDSGAMAPDFDYDGNTYLYYPRVQIRVRNASYLTGDTLINDIRDAVKNITHTTLGTTRYNGVFIDSGPAHLGVIDTNAGLANVWTMNIRAITED